MSGDEEQLRDDFLDSLRQSVQYWAEQKATTEERLNGMAFSMLCLIDGVAGGPALNLTLEEDPGTVLNAGTMLHELYYQRAG